jgi:integrase
VDLASGTLKVTRPKSKRHEVIPLNATAFALLAGLKQEGPLVFSDMPKSLSDTFVYYCRKAGLDDVSFHDLRDTFISRLAEHCNVPALMQLARHRNYQTTQRYLKLDDKHLRDIVEQIVPARQNDRLTGTRTGTTPFESL